MLTEHENGGNYVGRENEGEVQGAGYQRAFGNAGGSGTFSDINARRTEVNDVKAQYADIGRARKQSAVRRPEGLTGGEVSE